MADTATAPRIILETRTAGGAGGEAADRSLIRFSSIGKLRELAASKLGVSADEVVLTMPGMLGVEVKEDTPLCEADHVVAEARLGLPSSVVASSVSSGAARRGRDEDRASGSEVRGARLRLRVLRHGRRTLRIDASPSSTVEWVKAMIQDSWGFLSWDQILMLGKDEMEDGRDLASYGIDSSSALSLGLQTDFVRLSVKTLTGKAVNINVKPSDCVGELKATVWRQEGIPPDQQRLLYAGRILEDGMTIQDYHIFNESVIHLVLRLSGGKPVVELLGDWPAVGPVDVRLRLDAPFWSLAHAFPRAGLAARPDGSGAVWSRVEAAKDDPAVPSSSGARCTSLLRLGGDASGCRRSYSHLFWEADVDGAEAWRRWGPVLRGAGTLTWRRDEAAELLYASLVDEAGMPERMAQEMVEYWQPRLERSGKGATVRVALLSQSEVRGFACLDVVRSGSEEDAPCGDVVVGPSSCERVYLVFCDGAMAGSVGVVSGRGLLGSPLEGGRRVSVPAVGSGRVSVLEWGGVELEPCEGVELE